jgi:hypothetical protein
MDRISEILAPRNAENAKKTLGQANRVIPSARTITLHHGELADIFPVDQAARVSPPDDAHRRAARGPESYDHERHQRQ